MKLLILVLSLSLVFTASAYDARECFKTGSQNEELMSNLGPNWLSALCQGAKSSAPLECYDEIFNDGFFDTIFYPKHMAILCSGANKENAFGPIECYKEAFDTPEIYNNITELKIIDLCRKAVDLTPVECFVESYNSGMGTEQDPNMYPYHLVNLCRP